MSALLAVLQRELVLAQRQPADAVQPLVFYALVASLFPLGAAPGSSLLPAMAPGVLWVGALLAALLGLERAFRAEYEDGTLEQLFLAEMPASVVVLAKLLGIWLTMGLPLVIAAPLLGAMFHLPAEALEALVLTLLLGSPALVLLGGFAAALLVGLPRAGVLLPILVLPLVAPVLIFGTGAVRAAALGAPWQAPVYFLAAILVLCLSIVPLATAAALRNALE